MKSSILKPMAALLLAVAGLSGAQAASSWGFTTGGTETGAGAFGNARSYTASTGSDTVQVTAWSNTKNSVTAGNAYIESAYLGSYTGGLGITNRDGALGAGDTNEGTIANTTSPGHSMDNNTRFDSMLFDFGAGKSAKLNTLTVGWWQTDSDVTVLAYTGSGTPLFTTANQGYASLLSSGWSVVKGTAGTTGTADYSNAAGGTAQNSSVVANFKPLTVNDLNVSARFWLVGALNTLVQSLPSGATVDGGNDYVKIAAVSATYTKMPEPSSLALVGSAMLLGIVGMGRRRKN